MRDSKQRKESTDARIHSLVDPLVYEWVIQPRRIHMETQQVPNPNFAVILAYIIRAECSDTWFCWSFVNGAAFSCRGFHCCPW